MDWEATIERQSEAVRRILVALAAMAGLLDAARFSLPREIYRKVLRPLRAAELDAERLRASADAYDPAEAARLRLRMLAICRVIAHLIRRLLRPGQRPVCNPARAAGRLPIVGLACARRAILFHDSS